MILTLDIEQCFHRDWSAANHAFRECCARYGLTFHRYPHPLTGPGGEALETVAAWAGPEDAKRLLILVSGTHGVEGLAGSGCQLHWIESGGAEALPPGTAALLIHIINPWGCAWGRRQTEDNVDLNRNFRDFSGNLPRNILYEKLHRALLSPDRTTGARAVAEFQASHSETQFATALFKGQYGHPDGVGFGGQEPTWSNRTLRRILEDHRRGIGRAIGIDFHTGLGDYGMGLILSVAEPESQSAEAAARLFGDELIRVNAADSPLPYKVQGDLCSAIEQTIGGETLAIALEFGTFEVGGLLGLQIEDCWLHNHGDLASVEGQAIRGELRHFFYPHDGGWRQRIVQRAEQVIRKSLPYLGAVSDV
jgi:hypothetical protein